MTVDNTAIITKEMGLSHSDFFRLIPRALGSENYTERSDGVLYETEGRSLDIHISEEGVRKIALMVIPRTMVTLTFTGYSDDDRIKAVTLFDDKFRRGGG